MDLRSNRKQTNKWLVVGGVVLATVLIIGLIIGYNYWQQQKRKEQAEATATLFIEALEKQDYEEISSLVSEISLEDIDYTRQEVRDRYETVYGGIGATELSIDNYQLVEDEEAGEFKLEYVLGMNTSLGELTNQSFQTTFHETEDGFRVNWDPSLIFPEMALEDTLHVTMQSGRRGSIYDRNGELLAGEAPAWEAGLYPALLGEGEGREANIEAIADTLETNVEQLENLLSASWVTEESFVPVKIVEEDNRPEITGVVYQETTARTYPLAEAGAHLIGYTGEVFAEDIEEDPTLSPGDIIGKSGLEATFDPRLRGSKGGSIQILNENGETKTILQESVVEDGEDITITIDKSLQEAYYETFAGDSGSAVVTAPQTGELLVLTSSPSYDPTMMSRGISTEAYQAYADDENAPFLPRYTARYAPGSTFKAITGAIGLDSGVTTVEKTHTITGYEWQKDDTWGNHVIRRVQNQPTEVDLEDAYVFSDNIFFAREALEMGAETFMEGLEQFPFGEEFDLPIPMNPAQITNSGSFDNEMLLADTAYGQGQLLMSPLHQAVFYSPFATGGNLTYPVLEKSEETIEPMQPISTDAAAIVNEDLIQVVESPNGTAHALSNSTTRLAAKSGTAETQSQEDEETMDTNGFLLVYDAENQDFLSVILVEDAGGSDVVRQFSTLFN